MAQLLLPPTSFLGAGGGDVPGATPLVIGAVQFNSIECPEKLAIGAMEQKRVAIDLIGGSRSVQPMGVQPKIVEFSGTFWGANCEPRVAELQSYAVSAQQQTLSFLDETWTCIVAEFTPEWKNEWICDYKITLEIVTGSSLQNTTFPNVNSQIDGNNAQIQAALTQLQLQVDAEAFAPLNIAWQEYLAALGVLYAAEQLYQSL